MSMRVRQSRRQLPHGTSPMPAPVIAPTPQGRGPTRSPAPAADMAPRTRRPARAPGPAGSRVDATAPENRVRVLTVAGEPWDDLDGARLRAARQAEIDQRYGGHDHEPAGPPSAQIAVFVVVPDDGHALGCAALRQIDATSAEIKRMYITPETCGSGAATALLLALEHRALEHGWATLLLETGRRQPETMRFHQREGYRETETFGPYADEPGSLCYAATCARDRDVATPVAPRRRPTEPAGRKSRRMSVGP